MIFPSETDVVVIGAGAAGLMCALTAGRRGRRVLVVDHANKVGKKILMSGGGRCNFTNLDVSAANYLCENPHFCKSALARFTQWDFIGMVLEHEIPYHERDHGQLFCDNRAKDILNMLLDECQKVGVGVFTRCRTESIKPLETGGFQVQSSLGTVQCQSLVVATGGLSIPTLGSSGFGYELAEQFGHHLKPRRAGLVPFTLTQKQLQIFAPLVGNSADVRISCNGHNFRENLLFTHRGISGPVVLQISNYWQPGQVIEIDWTPDQDLGEYLLQAKSERPKAELKTVLSGLHTRGWASVFCEHWLGNQPLNQYSDQALIEIAEKLQHWQIYPAGTEGYKTAEVTLGGVDTDEVSSKTMESNKQPGLYFVGEVLDVTGWLGGYNFQWAWASGHAAGTFV